MCNCYYTDELKMYIEKQYGVPRLNIGPSRGAYKTTTAAYRMCLT